MTYIPPPPPDDEETIFARYQTGINFDKYDENIVEVSGLDPPAPLMVSKLLVLEIVLHNSARMSPECSIQS